MRNAAVNNEVGIVKGSDSAILITLNVMLHRCVVNYIRGTQEVSETKENTYLNPLDE